MSKQNSPLSYVISRHPGSRELAREPGYGGSGVISVDELPLTELRPGDRVYGVLPPDQIDLILAAGARYFAFVKPGGRLDEGEATVAELKERGAEFREVTFIALDDGAGGLLYHLRSGLLTWCIRHWRRIHRVAGELRTWLYVLEVGLFATIMGVSSNHIAAATQALVAHLGGGDPAKWTEIGLNAIFGALGFLGASVFGVWLLAVFRDAANPRASMPPVDVSHESHLDSIIVALSLLPTKKDRVDPSVHHEAEFVCPEALTKLENIANYASFDALRESGSTPQTKLNDAEIDLSINWSNLARQLAHNRECLKRVYLIADQQVLAQRTKKQSGGAASKTTVELAVTFLRSLWQRAGNGNELEIWLLGANSIHPVTTGSPFPLAGDFVPLEMLDVGQVQNAVARAIVHAHQKRRSPMRQIGVDLTGATAIYAVGAAIAALNRNVITTYIDRKNCYHRFEPSLEAGLFSEELTG